jgi:hypothetical protein
MLDMVFPCAANVKRNERIKLSPNTPAIDAADIPWVRLRSPMIKGMINTIVCSTFHAIESEALALLPKAA